MCWSCTRYLEQPDGGVVPLQAAYVRALLPCLARRAGIAKPVHAHGLRHTHAFELARKAGYMI